jgi:hypothetical protein
MKQDFSLIVSLIEEFHFRRFAIDMESPIMACVLLLALFSAPQALMHPECPYTYDMSLSMFDCHGNFSCRAEKYL